MATQYLSNRNEPLYVLISVSHPYGQGGSALKIMRAARKPQTEQLLATFSHDAILVLNKTEGKLKNTFVPSGGLS